MIRFIKEPPGKFRSRYKVGGTARFDKAREWILINKGYAVEISEETNKGKSGRLQSDHTEPVRSETIPVADNGSDGSGQHHNKPNKRSRTRN